VGTAIFGLQVATVLMGDALFGRPDVIHVHGDVYDLLGAIPTAFIIRAPLVMTVHGGLNQQPGYRRVASRLFRRVDQVIAVSQVVADDLLRMGVLESRVNVISSGIDVRPRGVARARHSGGGPYVLLFVGRLHEQKGVGVLLEAFERLVARGAEIELVIAGDGPRRAALEERAVGLRGVTFLGEVRPDHVPHLYEKADLFIMPSLDVGTQGEGTPTAIVEAMAAGLPVVCTDAGGMPSLVAHGANGLVVPQRDAECLADAIGTLLDNPRLGERMSEANRESARARFWPEIATKVDDVYRRARGESS
jgi:glycosyltransferase involved in cell wall biosynthesis